MAKKEQKAQLSMMNRFQEQLKEAPKAQSKAKKTSKKPVEKKQKEVKTTAPAPKEEKETSPTLEAKEGHIPRGERADFLKITLTIPAEMLTELRALGMKRKAAKQKDTDSSALIREALTDFLKKHRED